MKNKRLIVFCLISFLMFFSVNVFANTAEEALPENELLETQEETNTSREQSEKYKSADDYVIVSSAYNNTQSKGALHMVKTVLGALNDGFVATIKLFAITLIGALPLGLLISFCSMSKFLPLKYLTKFLVWVIRGTPLMLQLLLIFYFPGILMNGHSPWGGDQEGRFLAAAISFIINYAFYFSEIFRGGIESIPHGQIEAGQVLGMTKTQIFFKITLLQVVKRIVPPISNEIITLVKDTSLARTIAYIEIIHMGESFMTGTRGYHGLIWPLFFTGVYYLAFNGILTLLCGYIEKKLSYFKS